MASDENTFNKAFCEILEYHLCDTFENSENIELIGFWCDGVSHIPSPMKQLTPKSINDNRKLVTKAWIGKDGQDEYELTILFGPKTLSRYARNLSLADVLPSSKDDQWIDIDVDNFTIQLSFK